MREGLTEKRKRFVEAYCGEAKGNATEAARLAGYSGNQRTLESQASEILSIPEVSAAIRAYADKVRSSAIATAEEVQTFLTDVMRGAMSHAELNAMGEQVQVSPPWKVRVTAAVELGKMRGYSAPVKTDVNITGAPIVQVYLPSNGRDPA